MYIVEIKGGWDYLGMTLGSAVTLLIIQISIVLGSKQDNKFYMKIGRSHIFGFYYLRLFCSLLYWTVLCQELDTIVTGLRILKTEVFLHNVNWYLKVPVAVTCLGGHEIYDWPCYVANPTSCQRRCGRLLACVNHTCNLLCHTVERAPDEVLVSNMYV